MKKKKIFGYSLRVVILFVVILNTIIVLALASSFLLAKFENDSVKMALQHTKQSTNNMSKGASSIILDQQELLTKIVNEVFKTNALEKNKANQILTSYYNFHSNIVKIAIYNQDGEIYALSNNGRILKNLDNYNNLSFIPNENQPNQKCVIYPPHVNNMYQKYYPWVVTLSMKIIWANNTTLYCNMDIDFKKISQYVNKITLGDQGYVYIADKQGNIIYHPKQQLLYSGLEYENTDILLDLYKNEHLITDENIYNSTPIEGTEWYIIGVSSIYEMVQTKTDEFTSYVIIVLIVSSIIVLITGVILSNGLSVPFRKLMYAMKSYEQNIDLYQPIQPRGFLEVRELTTVFDSMATNVKALKSRVAQEELALKKAELLALQAQINPHFLYNTLDSIFWLCKDEGNEKAAEMVSALSNTFRISISRGKDEISVKEELQHAKSYLSIQNIRYQDQFTYNIKVDDSILECKCLKILLQPFIENAIYHGINLLMGDGEININAYQKDGNIVFEITDNGIGMDEEEISNLFQENSKTAGIGILNVDQRIKVFYGDKYGVQIESEPDEGTTVRIVIPIRMEKEIK